MRKFPFFAGMVVAVLVSAGARAQYEKAVPTAQAMANTFNIYGDKLTGSGFMVNAGGNQYFVTAAHLFAASHRTGDPISIQLVIQAQLQSYTGTLYFHSDRNVDVAVLKLAEPVEQNLSLPDEAAKYGDTLKKVFHGNGFALENVFIAAGMESYFMGFPLGNLGTEVFGIKLPLVKKAIMSGMIRSNGVDVLLLDGHNNLGFSGGPVVMYDEEKKTMRLVGVISGYLPEPVNVKNKNETLSVLENSGIIVCYGTQYIMDIFKKNDLR